VAIAASVPRHTIEIRELAATHERTALQKHLTKRTKNDGSVRSAKSTTKKREEGARVRRARTGGRESAVLATIARCRDRIAPGDGSMRSSKPARQPSRRDSGTDARVCKDGKVVCFFQSAQKFKTRYATFGFMHERTSTKAPCADRLRAEGVDCRRRGKDRALVKKAVS